MKRRAIVALALGLAGTILLPGMLVGCASETEAPAPATQQRAPRPVEPMPVEIRTVQLPASFPIEVPVPDGRVKSAVEQDEGGQGAWTYELASESSVADLAAWYTRAYSAANWTLSEQNQGTAGDLSLVFLKGGAQSVIRLAPNEGGTEVNASVGVGIPVADTL